MKLKFQLIIVCLLMVLVGTIGLAELAGDPIATCEDVAGKQLDAALRVLNNQQPFAASCGSIDCGLACSCRTIPYQEKLYNLQRASSKSWATYTWASALESCKADFYERELNKLSRWAQFLEFIGFQDDYSGRIYFFRQRSSEALKTRSEEESNLGLQMQNVNAQSLKIWNDCMASCR